MEGVLLANCRTWTHSLGTLSRNIKDSFELQSHSYIELLPLQYSLGDSLNYHRVIHTKNQMKRFYIQFITQTHSPCQRGSVGMPPFNGKEVSLMIFLRNISCLSSQPTLSPPFIPEGYHFGLRLQDHSLTTRQKDPHKTPYQKHSRSHVINTYNTKIIQHPMSRHMIFTFIMYQVRYTSVQHKTHPDFTLSHFAYH